MMFTKYFFYSHPLFVAIAPAVFLWSINYGEVGYDEALTTIGAILLVSLLALGILYFILGSLSKSAIASSAILFISLNFSYLFESLLVIDVVVPWRWSVPLSCGAILLVLYLVYRTTKDLLILNKILTVISVTFVLLSVIQIVNEFRTQHFEIVTEKPTFVADGNVDELRDIYYIILDGYSSPEIIREVFGYQDIEEFTSFLNSEGFFVATKSRSNYASTRLSLPSSLNMQLLGSPKHTKKYDLMFEDNLVKDFLKARGYKYIHFGANAFTFHNRYADENINVSALSPYQLFIWTRSLFYPLLTFASDRVGHNFFEEFGGVDLEQKQAERVRYQLDRLGNIANEYEEPIFVFAHFASPKGSLFDPQGNLMSDEELSKKSQAEIYVEQVAFINNEMEKLISKLKDNSELDPIIVIQGDHGYQFIADDSFNDSVVLAEIIPESIAIEEMLVSEDAYSFPIFNAYYFPGVETNLLYETISPVNTFRVVFNAYFNEDFDLLEDKSYIPDESDGAEFVPLNTYSLGKKNEVAE